MCPYFWIGFGGGSDRLCRTVDMASSLHLFQKKTVIHSSNRAFLFTLQHGWQIKKRANTGLREGGEQKRKYYTTKIGKKNLSRPRRIMRLWPAGWLPAAQGPAPVLTRKRRKIDKKRGVTDGERKTKHILNKRWLPAKRHR